MTTETEQTAVAPPRDGGLATEYWKQYYEPDEVGDCDLLARSSQ